MRHALTRTRPAAAALGVLLCVFAGSVGGFHVRLLSPNAHRPPAQRDAGIRFWWECQRQWRPTHATGAPWRMRAEVRQQCL